MSKIRLHLLTAISLLLLSGCSGGQTAVRSDTHLLADKALNRGIRAEQKGDLPTAETFLLQSLATSRSIEDYPGQATALINLARLHRLKHEPAQAEEYADRALTVAAKAPALQAEAAYEKALVELSLGQNDSALKWAQKSLAAEQVDKRRGTRLNLVARIQFLRGAMDESRIMAADALTANRAAGQAEEEANSLRMLGMVARQEERYEAGIGFLEEALQIDKRIGQSDKIAADLEELGLTADKAGRIKQAAEYRERAGLVHKPSTTTSPSSRP
jgi:tetratricopeptide (TPR) repeat protein